MQGRVVPAGDNHDWHHLRGLFRVVARRAAAPAFEFPALNSGTMVYPSQ